jgi:outer membrane lipoprotein-sorting protein
MMFSTKNLKLLLLSFFLSGTVAFAADPSPEEILKIADRARGSTALTEGISWRVNVQTKSKDDKNSITYDLKVKGNDALAEAVAPTRNKGEVMIFNDRSIWFFKPGLKKPVAISPRQKLMGQASNGDIASTNYARDYSATSMATEVIDGVPAWKLELKAKEKNVTYDRIRYWVNKKEGVGIKAEFLTISGDPFKEATFQYKNKMKTDGKEYPFVSEMVITDSLIKSNVTTLSYESPKPSKFSSSIFNVNNLIR